MLICPHSGLGNQIGNYVFGQYLINNGIDVKFLFTEKDDIDRPFMLDKFNTILPAAAKIDIENFINSPANFSMYKILAKNLLFDRRHYLNSLFKVLKRIQIEHNIPVKKNPKLMCKIVSYNDILKHGQIPNSVVCDCYSPIIQFQDENFKNKIRQHFILKQTPDEKNCLTAQKIDNCKNSVGIHIRRGDYLNLNIPVVKKSFILDKMKFFNNEFSGVEFFIFSDDILWAQKNLSDFSNANFVDINDEKSGYLDFVLLNKCAHRVYSASSFSKWAMYLNPFLNSVEFSPKKDDLTIEQ